MEGSPGYNWYFIQGVVELLGNQITSASNEKFEADTKISVKTQERADRELDCLSTKQEYDTETAKRWEPLNH
jgi:hypothetical protein